MLYVMLWARAPSPNTLLGEERRQPRSQGLFTVRDAETTGHPRARQELVSKSVNDIYEFVWSLKDDIEIK